jgi:serine/threonine protein kinase
MIGSTILHYTITSELGAGAMGRVYLARDTRTDRWVALKFPRRDFDRTRMQQATGYHREALAGLDTLERMPAMLPEEAAVLPMIRARSLKALGQRDEAARICRTYLASMRNADPGLRPVEEAKAMLPRLTALTGRR